MNIIDTFVKKYLKVYTCLTKFNPHLTKKIPVFEEIFAKKTFLKHGDYFIEKS